MLCGLACAAALVVTPTATPTAGPAPLKVTFTATGDAASFHWNFGDGDEADGRVVEHVYAAGRWTATVTDGVSTAQIAITAYGVTLQGPQRVRWKKRAVFRGAVVPAERDVPVTVTVGDEATLHAHTTANGSFSVRRLLHAPAAVVASANGASSGPLSVQIVPRLVTRLLGSGARGGHYVLAANVRPARAGALVIRIERGGATIADRTYGASARITLDTRKVTTYRIRVEVQPNEGFTSAAHVLRAHVVLPRLAFGSRGSAVAQVASRLHALHYAVPYTATFDGRLLDAVYAFQKVHSLPRTGVVDARVWRVLANAATPLPRYARPADHLEVNKPRQVLYVVRGSRVALIVPVSTAGIGGTFTPVGRFAIYRKVVGFDPSPLGTLFDPMYFTGGYAIHGNPSVPPYPASHGCIRVPMWIAPNLYATNWYGETVYVY